MRDKKVLLVEPKGVDSNVFDRYMTIPLLGPVYLGTMASQAGYDVKILNENIAGRKVTDKELASADVLAVSCLTQTIERGKEIAGKYRNLRENSGLESKSIIGGIHASMLPRDVSDNFDHVVKGEGEKVFLEILSGEITDNTIDAGRQSGFGNAPIPDFNLIEGWKGTGILPVSTSKGCPHDCSFCCVTSMEGRKYRDQSLERVLEEASRYDPNCVFFVDNHFVAKPKRTDDLLDMMIASGFNTPWTAQTRVDIAKRKGLVEKMSRAGCDAVYVGVESANQATLDAMNKKQKVSDVEYAVRAFHDNGIKVHGMSIIGNDTDDIGEFARLSDFYNETGIDYAQFSILTPFPEIGRGKIYDQLNDEGRILHKNWSLYDAMHVVYKPKNMTVKELQKGMIDCYSEFYSVPKAIKVAATAMIDSAALYAGRMLDKDIDITRPARAAKEMITGWAELYREKELPSFRPAAIRLMGSRMLKQWIEDNKEYLSKLSLEPQLT